MTSIFLSHNSRDKPFVRRLAERLQKEGLNIWLDEVNLFIGDSLITEISGAIKEVEYVVAVISKNSLNSGWVQKELSLAMTKEIEGTTKVILPLVIDNCNLPDNLKDKLYADFRRYEETPEVFERGVIALLKAIGVSKERWIEEDDNTSNWASIPKEWRILLSKQYEIKGNPAKHILEEIYKTKNFTLNLENHKKIKSIQPLQNFINLESLNVIDAHKVQDWSQINQLKNLRHLSAAHAEDIPILELPKEIETLYLPGVFFNYNVLSKYEKLKELTFGSDQEGYEEGKLEFLAQLKDIKILDIGVEVTNTKVLSKLKKLRDLRMSTRYIENTDYVRYLEKLRFLRSGTNGHFDFTTIRSSQIEAIQLKNLSSVSNVKSLENFPRLRHIWLDGTGIGRINIEEFYNLHRLTQLNIFHFPIEKFNKKEFKEKLPGCRFDSQNPNTYFYKTD